MWYRIPSLILCGDVLSVLACNSQEWLTTESELQTACDEEESTSFLQVETVRLPVARPEEVHVRRLQVPFEPGETVPEWKLLGRNKPAMLLHVPYNHIGEDIPYSSLKEQVFTFPQRKPCELNVILATLKTWTADAVVQMVQRPGGSSWFFDWKRSAAFAIFGFIYVGCVQWFLYVTILTWLFPGAVIFANEPWYAKLSDTTGQLDVVGQILVDNFVFSCFIYFPAFYTIKAFLQEHGSLPQRAYAGLCKYRTNIVTDNISSWCIWIVADIGIFACPMYMRMPLEHAVSFAWTMFISFLRGAGAEPDKNSKK
mmetsp:Transcript_35573/g.62841  ORF Transcript_35573/g.62841 Transcript_35573/m.62841 type:complete len:312 (-) Transcript_35573:28-963(-)